MNKKKKKTLIIGIIIIVLCFAGFGTYVYIKSVKVHIQFITYKQKVDEETFNRYFKPEYICKPVEEYTLKKMGVYEKDMHPNNDEYLCVSYNEKVTDFYYNKYMPEKYYGGCNPIMIYENYIETNNGYMYIYKVKETKEHASLWDPLY